MTIDRRLVNRRLMLRNRINKCERKSLPRDPVLGQLFQFHIRFATLLHHVADPAHP